MRWLKIGCLAAVVLGCLGTGILFAVAHRAVGAVQDAEVACSGAPVPGATGGGPTRALGFVRDAAGARFHYAGTLLPSAFTRATAASEATVVLCIEPDVRTTVEECSYVDGSSITRYRHAREVRAVAAADGHLLRSMLVSGPEPAACPDALDTGSGGPGIGVRVMGVPVGTVGGGPSAPTQEAYDGGSVSAEDLAPVFADLAR